MVGEVLLHHGLLEGAGLFAAALQGLQLRVDLAQDLGDGGSLGGLGAPKLDGFRGSGLEVRDVGRLVLPPPSNEAKSLRNFGWFGSFDLRKTVSPGPNASVVHVPAQLGAGRPEGEEVSDFLMAVGAWVELWPAAGLATRREGSARERAGCGDGRVMRRRWKRCTLVD